jgi:hypothetical protein
MSRFTVQANTRLEQENKTIEKLDEYNEKQITGGDVSGEVSDNVIKDKLVRTRVQIKHVSNVAKTILSDQGKKTLIKVRTGLGNVTEFQMYPGTPVICKI